MKLTINFTALSLSNATEYEGGASTNNTTFFALYSAIVGYFLLCHFAKRKCYSLVLNTFLSKLFCIPGGKYRKKLCRALQYKTTGVLKALGTVFPKRTYLHREGTFFLSSEIALFELEKRNRKEGYHAYKISRRFEGFFLWMYNSFFHFAHSGLNPFTFTFQ